ncbi:MAG: recombination protein RecR [Candidatus Buchananbacteria bacterium CG10_big_fil_rev_8_21_14_0_10_42_9]|uniref:Recombination protein RecR n=1 Tax=Candidatus Buchananbacteria bacterium CG10_big_fil_rev_8_21_14_0_10_42_9 TaxID=1974526 RepID=A0A2H0W3M7_9BACT|nr:MAG: recombination protein RecR [Candidatus Buchananbacteria bacterium CG10_big_fil_rev_8_21_14_0_10_42_9]
MAYPKPIEKVIEHFSKLPGIGPKAAARFVFYLLKRDPAEIKAFAEDLGSLQKLTNRCEKCFIYTENKLCQFCTDATRDHKIICVVARPQDIIALESSGNYKGLYHNLDGLLNPLEGATPESTGIDKLIKRLKAEPAQEIILGFNPTIEGESTILYLAKALKPLNIKVTRLARGIPMNAELDHVDDITMESALKNRKEL